MEPNCTESVLEIQDSPHQIEIGRSRIQVFNLTGCSQVVEAG